jgi:hypothetical protein
MASRAGLYRSCFTRATRRSRLAAVAFVLGAFIAAPAHTQPPPIPEHNRADLKEAPPRPAPDSAEAAARLLFEAIVRDQPQAAAAAFFPRPAFLLVKDIKDPGRYYDQLYARFIADVHALHKSLPEPANAQFERFELSARGGFMRVHEEGNRLPYWAARHSILYYRSAGQLRHFEVRVLITWDDRWYVIHLNEFH